MLMRNEQEVSRSGLNRGLLQAPNIGSAPYIGHSIYALCSSKQLLYPLILVIARIIHTRTPLNLEHSETVQKDK